MVLLAVMAATVLTFILVQRMPRVLFEGESALQPVRVVERANGLRSLYTGGRSRQTALYPDRPLHLELDYTRVGMIGLAMVPDDARILFVGLGGGAMPTYTRLVLPEATIDVVEIDTLIVDVAQRWFGFRPDDQLRVHTADGRAFIEDAQPASWDLIVLDAFAENGIPYSLTTRQFLEAVSLRLAPRGLVVSNVWSSARLYRSMLATYQAVFGEVQLVRVPRRAQRIVLSGPGVAGKGRADLVRAAEALAARVDLGFDLSGLVARGYEALPALRGQVLEDHPVGGRL